MVRKRQGLPTATSDRFPNDPATAYAVAAVEGKAGRAVGELELAACRRHLRDLDSGHSRGLRWEPDRAMHAIGFFPAVLSVTAGAMAGKPFELLPWHKFSAGSIFGWRKTSGRMRFRSAWMETGKGQAKSPFMGAIGLYLMGYYGVPRAEVYAIGQDRRTANVLFRDAVAMCRAPIPGGDETDTLEARGEVVVRGVGDNGWKIEHPDSGSIFQVLANGETVSGPRPIAVLADEIHEFSSNGAIETWRRAITKMPGDAIMLLGTNTPASNQIAGTEYSEFYQKVAKGEIEDDEAFAFIARVDKADWDTVLETPEVWSKSLPALGITFPVENIVGEVNTAKVLLSTALSTKRLYFGIPIGSSKFWIDEAAWMAVQGKFEVAKLKGCPCWLALDLSKKNDLTALTAVWMDDDGRIGPKGHLYAKTWYWTTKDGLADRSRADLTPYDQWAEPEKAFITAVPGAVIDKTFVAAEVRKIEAEHNVQFMAFDAAFMLDFEAACEEIGFPTWRFLGPDEPAGEGLMLVNHAQGNRVRFEDRQLTMPRSIERLEDEILDKTITIEDSPVTYSCASKAYVEPDGQGNRMFDKKRSRGRIDGLVTIAMAVGAALNEMGGSAEERSVYEDRGLLEIEIEGI